MPRLRRAAAAAVALVILAPVVACGSEPVSPLPFDAPSPPGSSITSDVSPSPQTSSQPETAQPSPSATSARPSACLGAVVYKIDADDELGLIDSLCLAVGAILRVEGTGPGTVSVTPQDSASCGYEAGIVQCRFLSPRTVTVSIKRNQNTYRIQVVVR